MAKSPYQKQKKDQPAFLTREGWVILHPDGNVELSYFDVKNKPKTMETFRRTYRPDCRIVRAILTIPNVPLLKKR